MGNEMWRASPVLGVRHVRQAAEYYRDVLGFSLDPVDGVFQPTEDEPGGVYAIVKRGGVWIHFQIRRGNSPERKRNSLERDVYVYVDDLDALYGDLQRRGAVITQPPCVTAYGLREMVVEDLNGYRLALENSCGSSTEPAEVTMSIPYPMQTFGRFKLGMGLTHKLTHDRFGFDMGERYHRDLDYRIQTTMDIDRAMFESYGQIGLGYERPFPR